MTDAIGGNSVSRNNGGKYGATHSIPPSVRANIAVGFGMRSLVPSTTENGKFKPAAFAGQDNRQALSAVKEKIKKLETVLAALLSEDDPAMFIEAAWVKESIEKLRELFSYG